MEGEKFSNARGFESVEPETSYKPVFSDSDRESENEFPELDKLDVSTPSDVLFKDNKEMYSDSDRDTSYGPEWNDKDFGDVNYKDYLDELYKDTKDDVTENNNSETKETEDDCEDDSPEYDEDGTRKLTEEESQELKEKLGWSDEKLKKCRIDKDGVIHYKTDRCDLEGKTSENGVPYVRRTIVINGVKIEGVFPKFNSIFDTQLSPENYKSKAYAKECNAKLKEAIENDPELRSKFTPEQIKDIEEGRTPRGYVWHHNEEPGKMQLVKREDHDKTMGGAAHTGGNSLWGADSVDNTKKGESF